MWEKIIRWPLRPHRSCDGSSSTKTSWISHLPPQPTLLAGPLHQMALVPLPRTKVPQIPSPLKVIYQLPPGVSNQVQTTHNQRKVLAQKPNFLPIVKVPSRQPPVLAKATLTWITPSRLTTRLKSQTTARKLRHRSANLSKCTRMSEHSSNIFFSQVFFTYIHKLSLQIFPTRSPT